MIDYDSVIEFENEHSGLDFKAKQYTRDKYTALLKDVMAMANAKTDGYRLIIIGIKLNPDGTRTPIPISNSDFVDSATYEQLVSENIEPELNIKYFQHNYQGALLGILELGKCADQPYMMKKDYGDKLKKGACFVRKGSHQVPASRSDHDRMYGDRQLATKFTNHLLISFNEQDSAIVKLYTKPMGALDLPSDRQARKIKSVICNKKESMKEKIVLTDVLPLMTKLKYPLGYSPYEERDITTLQKNLECVKETYAEDDIYEIFEHHALKLNLFAFNSANEYVFDATCVIEFPEIKGICVFKDIIYKPIHGPLDPARFTPRLLNYSYPTVTVENGLVRISQEVGDIKHHRATQLFKEDVRIAISKPEDRRIPITVNIYAKNLPKPFTANLEIEIENVIEE